MYAGLKPEDSKRWGQFTTIKGNAGALARRGLAAGQIVYCSPLVDPYQPAERDRPLMPAILEAVIRNPPDVFVIQTRGSLIVRDLDLLREVARATTLRVSYSVTTDREDVRRRYEPHCSPITERLGVIRELREAGLETYATLAPILPCDPERLAQMAVEASGRDLIGDPLHIRATKPRGATTRAVAFEIARRNGELDWFEPEFQRRLVDTIRMTAAKAGIEFIIGTSGFGRLARRAKAATCAGARRLSSG